MKKSNKKLDRNKLITEFINYVSSHSKKYLNTKFNIWSTYPICVQDIAVESVWIDSGKICFGDFDKTAGVLVCRRDSDNTDTQYLSNALEDMKLADKSSK